MPKKSQKFWSWFPLNFSRTAFCSSAVPSMSHRRAFHSAPSRVIVTFFSLLAERSSIIDDVIQWVTEK
jgi:hypothetical protein